MDQAKTRLTESNKILSLVYDYSKALVVHIYIYIYIYICTNDLEFKEC